MPGPGSGAVWVLSGALYDVFLVRLGGCCEKGESLLHQKTPKTARTQNAGTVSENFAVDSPISVARIP